MHSSQDSFPLITSILASVIMLVGTANGQQLNNNSFENWEEVNETMEPIGWNTIMTGDLCRFCSFIASQRVFEDTESFIDGQRSIRIESKSILGDVIFNGSITTGQIAVPKAAADAGFNQTLRGNDNFNQTIHSVPDSLVFWAKYNITDNSDSALVAFFIHGDVNLKVPVPNQQQQMVVATVHNTFQTNGGWQRIALPFEKVSDNLVPNYVLATFSSSYKAGKGNGSAKLWVDKVEFVYNTEQLSLERIK